MAHTRRPPSQTRRAFLNNRVDQLLSTDFFVVPAATFRALFVFVVLAHHGAGWLISTSPPIRLPNGQHAKSPRLSPGTPYRNIFCMIEIRPMGISGYQTLLSAVSLAVKHRRHTRRPLDGRERIRSIHAKTLALRRAYARTLPEPVSTHRPRTGHA
jgi:hypothetical protein